ncbi:MAG: aminoacyl-tRNA hydrolase [Deltaproteobacteria bacterium]|nr:aminoacyl-tRNA hydrolase [Deltaproteobacteria bacterium]
MGLGNPGPEYKDTRHNIGFKVLDLLCSEYGVRLQNRRFQSRNTLIKVGGKDIILLCPMTYMNLSGNAVRLCADYYKIDMEHILVVYDDLDLQVGRIKVARGGGAGGHKGIKSIIANLGGTEFPRIRIGIGRPLYNENTEDFVLSPFYKDQKDAIESAVQTAVKACRLVIMESVEYGMNRINNKNPGDRGEKNDV